MVRVKVSVVGIALPLKTSSLVYFDDNKRRENISFDFNLKYFKNIKMLPHDIVVPYIFIFLTKYKNLIKKYKNPPKNTKSTPKMTIMALLSLLGSF